MVVNRMDANSYNIDGHKLNLHPERVSRWLQGESIYPIYMEFSPSGTCNHRCVFCSMDFMGYKKRFLDAYVVCRRLRECGELGVRSVMFAGEGEPLLHKEICRMAQAASEAGIDVAFTTNGVLLDEERAARLLPITSWIKVSCNAATEEEYARVHRTAPEDFSRAIRNIERAAAIRARNGYACTLGFQCILLPEYAANMPKLARRAREAGADYLVVKPYTHSPLSLHNPFGDLQYGDYAELEAALRAEESDDFRIIFRREAMQRWNDKKAAFDRCLALPFWAYVDSGANVWGCLRHLKEDDFLYGNLNEQSFSEIWQGEKRLSAVRRCEEGLDISECHVTCRMELVNNYLWRLRHPHPHDNFI